MEIELKLRLFSSQSYQKVLDYFNSLSSSSSNLRESNKTVLRLRTCAEAAQEATENKETTKDKENNLKSNQRKYAVVTVKSNSVLVDGVQTVEEEEQSIPLDVVASLMKSPSTTLLSLESSKKYRVIDLINTRFPSTQHDYSRWTILGSYKTLRSKFLWEGVTVEVDKTEFHFDETAYEIEIEADKELIPDIKRKMVRVLNEIGVEFGESKRNKFMNMRVGRID
ncbi:hypothetical protein BKA69DRAFT_819770 [Paraphysoderma sedebokerense]|nr:hypothetical protein BKA69DRAFT_819770 [Paraphysoderma sedebokerense]